MSRAICRHHLCRTNSVVFNLIKFKRFTVAKMLKNFFVFPGNCNSHIFCSFLRKIRCFLIRSPFFTLWIGTRLRLSAAKPIMPAGDPKPFSVYKTVGHLVPCTLVNFRYRCARDFHLFCRFLMAFFHKIHQTKHLKLIYRKNNCRLRHSPFRRKARIIRLKTNRSLPLRSWHFFTPVSVICRLYHNSLLLCKNFL